MYSIRIVLLQRVVNKLGVRTGKNCWKPNLEVVMKFIILFAIYIVSACALSDRDVWEKFKNDYSKTYKNVEENKQRFSIFQSNLRTIEEHNARYERGEETYFMKVNQFTDLLREEFRRKYLGYKKPEADYGTKFELAKGAVVPDEIDWRRRGAVLPVQYQFSCGSSWAFSTTGALEGQNFIKYNISLALSTQQLLDCSKENSGCDGGHMTTAFKYLMNSGTYTDDSYPYASWDSEIGRCQVGRDSGITVMGYAVVNSSENALKDAVGTVGPIAIGIDGDDLDSYGGGIFNKPDCGQELNYNVLVVGYGSENGLDYWIVKNFWGPIWGENGYFRIIRNKNQQCGISMDNSFPILK